MYRLPSDGRRLSPYYEQVVKNRGQVYDNGTAATKFSLKIGYLLGLPSRSRKQDELLSRLTQRHAYLRDFDEGKAAIMDKIAKQKAEELKKVEEANARVAERFARRREKATVVEGAPPRNSSTVEPFRNDGWTVGTFPTPGVPPSVPAVSSAGPVDRSSSPGWPARMDRWTGRAFQSPGIPLPLPVVSSPATVGGNGSNPAGRSNGISRSSQAPRIPLCFPVISSPTIVGGNSSSNPAGSSNGISRSSQAPRIPLRLPLVSSPASVGGNGSSNPMEPADVDDGVNEGKSSRAEGTSDGEDDDFSHNKEVRESREETESTRNPKFINEIEKICQVFYKWLDAVSLIEYGEGGLAHRMYARSLSRSLGDRCRDVEDTKMGWSEYVVAFVTEREGRIKAYQREKKDGYLMMTNKRVVPKVRDVDRKPLADQAARVAEESQLKQDALLAEGLHKPMSSHRQMKPPTSTPAAAAGGVVVQDRASLSAETNQAHRGGSCLRRSDPKSLLELSFIAEALELPPVDVATKLQTRFGVSDPASRELGQVKETEEPGPEMPPSDEVNEANPVSDEFKMQVPEAGGSPPTEHKMCPPKTAIQAPPRSGREHTRGQGSTSDSEEVTGENSSVIANGVIAIEGRGRAADTAVSSAAGTTRPAGRRSRRLPTEVRDKTTASAGGGNAVNEELMGSVVTTSTAATLPGVEPRARRSESVVGGRAGTGAPTDAAPSWNRRAGVEARSTMRRSSGSMRSGPTSRTDGGARQGEDGGSQSRTSQVRPRATHHRGSLTQPRWNVSTWVPAEPWRCW